LGRNIQIGTTAAIIAVFLHNILREREVNDMASKGWTLIYTLPAFLICVLFSILIAIVLAIRFRRHLRLPSGRSTPTEIQKAEQAAS
jgi:ABC-type polysaccharide/polyol phosphate export permease